MRTTAYFADQPLDGLLTPSLDSLLQCPKLMKIVSSGVSRLELDEKLKGGLIGIGLQASSHLVPPILELAGTMAARFGAEASVCFGSDLDSTCASIFPPLIYTTQKPLVLLWAKATWVLNA